MPIKSNIPSPDEPEPKRINHESMKGRKHEKKPDKFRAFKISCFRDEVVLK